MVVLVVFVVVGANTREHTKWLRTTTHSAHILSITITNHHHHNENMRHLCAVGTATAKMGPRNTGMSPCDAMQNEPARTTSISARMTHRTIIFRPHKVASTFCAHR